MRRFKDHLGREFIVESPWRDMSVKFDTDNPHAAQMVLLYADWLDDNGCPMEAELIRLQWSMKIGTLAPGSDAIKRVLELKKYFGITDTFRVSKRAVIPTLVRRRDGATFTQNRDQLIQLFLEEPLGYWYSKATVNLMHIQEFLDVLHDHPIIHLCLVCNGTSAPALVHKYLNYPWLRKCMSLELNNFGIDFLKLRELFTNTSIQPGELIISGPERREPTQDQMRLLPLLCPGLKYLWRLKYGRSEYLYRTQEGG